jgi:peptide/nickel transport system permease protein
VKLDEAPAGANAPTPPPIKSARQITWVRRRKALGRFWATYRRNRLGMVGLVVLVFFGIVAIYSIFMDKDQLQKTNVTEESIAPCTFATLPCPPSANNPLGTDKDGRSVLALTIEGSRVSLTVGLAASVIAMVVGSLVGILAGYVGRWPDSVLMRLTDFFLVIPWLPLAIVLAAIFGQNLIVLIAIIGFTSWPGTARLVRAQTLSVREHLYVERSRALGATNSQVVPRHILPNVMPVIFANTILTVAIAILSESSLSFLGLGDPRRVTWGTMIDAAFDAGAISIGAWWWLMAPSLCIVLVVLAFTLCGYALDEIINPRMRER